MAQSSIAQHISAIRDVLKLNNADSRVTDRNIYLLMYHLRPVLLKETRQWIMHNSSVFQTIPSLELIDVDTVEACGIQTDCKIKRSKDKLPAIVSDYRGPIIKSVNSLDASEKLVFITPSEYLKKRKKSTFKFDKSIYFWITNNYLYFPNVEWDNVRLEAYLETDYISECDDPQPCKYFQENLFRLPEELNEKLYQLVFNKLLITAQTQLDHKIDKNSNMK